MAPKFTIAVMGKLPHLNPEPSTVVAAQILSNPLFYNCRISDYLHLVFQWHLHLNTLPRTAVTVFRAAYVDNAHLRKTRHHEGHAARAPDGTIMEIDGEACPGSSDEKVGPWDFSSVHKCRGFKEWSRGLTRSVADVLRSGGKVADIKLPQPSKEELQEAATTSGLEPARKQASIASRKRLLAMRYGIRDKIEGFLKFIDQKVGAEQHKNVFYDTMKDVVESHMVGQGTEGEKYLAS